MTTVILVGLIVVLLAAAAYVGLLLLRRTRSAPGASEPGGERPRTVADLVRRAGPTRRTSLSGPELFVPAVPRQDGVAVPDAPEARGGRSPLRRLPSRRRRRAASRSATPRGGAPPG